MPSGRYQVSLCSNLSPLASSPYFMPTSPTPEATPCHIHSTSVMTREPARRAGPGGNAKPGRPGDSEAPHQMARPKRGHTCLPSGHLLKLVAGESPKPSMILPASSSIVRV
ncbi:hypothetical protein TgHK011_004097 [Trichoderma gracile]|nr:hypothetical protein TgHK011_004097 [Trichoderma gracile]